MDSSSTSRLSLEKASRRFGPAEVIAIVLLLFVVGMTWNRSKKTFGFDFYQFWVVGREIGSPSAKNVYSDPWRIETGQRYWQMGHAPDAPPVQTVASDRRRTLQTFSTPLLYTFFAAIGTANYAHSLLLYQCVHLASGALAIAILCRILGYSLSTTILAIAVLYGWGEAYLSEIFCSNVNQIELLAIAMLLWFETRRGGVRRDILCGAWLGCIVLFKPNVIAAAGLMGLMWMVDGQRRRLALHATGFVVAAIVIVVGTSIRFGTAACWVQWFGAIRELGKTAQFSENYSLYAVLLANVGVGAARVMEWVVPVAACVAVALSRKRLEEDNRPGTDMRLMLVVALGCAAPLLSSPVCWMHYHVLGTPLLLFMLRPRGDDSHRSADVARYLIGGLALVLLCQSYVVTEWFWLSDAMSRAERLSGAVAAMFVLGLVQMNRQSAARP